MQSSSQIITTNVNFFTDRMPFLSPNQQCQNTEGKISHSMDLLTQSSPGGLPTLSLTINSSWLPWGRVAMPLHQPSDASTPARYSLFVLKVQLNIN